MLQKNKQKHIQNNIPDKIWMRVFSTAIFSIISFSVFTYAANMQSSNYNIEFDSINSGGGFSSSPNFNQENTFGEISTGYSNSSNYEMHAGYQQECGNSISLSSPIDINISNLSLTKNTAVQSVEWNVSSDNCSGYTLSLNATSTPALQTADGSFSFADLATTPATWAVSNAYAFGFSVLGTNVNTATFGTDTDCVNTADVPSATLKWRGFTGTSTIAVSSSAAVTPTSGTATTMCVATEQNGVFAPSGTYTATVVATLVAN